MEKQKNRKTKERKNTRIAHRKKKQIIPARDPIQCKNKMQ